MSSQESALNSSLAIQITLLYFASARTALSLSSEQIPLPSSSFALSSLGDLLLQRHPEAAQELKAVLVKSAWSVNEEIVFDPEECILQNGDVVAVIPPVSGG